MHTLLARATRISRSTVLTGALIGCLLAPVLVGLHSRSQTPVAAHPVAYVTITTPAPTVMPTRPPVRSPQPVPAPRKVAPAPVQPARPSAAGSWTCTASTYGYDYQGVAYSAAMTLVPHGHHVRVMAPNGNTVVVLITDSGPYVPGRCIDLSATAMRALGYPIGLIDDVRVTRID